MSDPIAEMQKLKELREKEKEKQKKQQKESRPRENRQKKSDTRISKNFKLEIDDFIQGVFERSFHSMKKSLKNRFKSNKAGGKQDDWDNLQDFIHKYIIPLLPHELKFKYPGC